MVKSKNIEESFDSLKYLGTVYCLNKNDFDYQTRKFKKVVIVYLFLKCSLSFLPVSHSAFANGKLLPKQMFL